MHNLYKVDTKGKVRVWWIGMDESTADPELLKRQIQKEATKILNEMMLQEYITVTGELPHD